VVLALVTAALAAPEAWASSPHPDEIPAYEVRTCKGEGFALTAPEYESLQLHNEAREEAGLDHLCLNPTLTEAARAHAADMIERDYFAHDAPGGAGVEPIDRMMDVGYSGYSAYGENIAYATGPLADSRPIFDSLMESPGHRENILRGTFLEVGVGAAGSADGSLGMYAMDFGARPGQPHNYPRLLPTPKGGTPPTEGAPSGAPAPGTTSGIATNPGRDETPEDAGGDNLDGQRPQVSDPRQALLCEILAETETETAAFADDLADDFGWTFLDDLSCDGSAELRYGGADGPGEATTLGLAPDAEGTSP
jgi:uncharacterized protein YkwD